MNNKIKAAMAAMALGASALTLSAQDAGGSPPDNSQPPMPQPPPGPNRQKDAPGIPPTVFEAWSLEFQWSLEFEVLTLRCRNEMRMRRPSCYAGFHYEPAHQSPRAHSPQRFRPGFPRWAG